MRYGRLVLAALTAVVVAAAGAAWAGPWLLPEGTVLAVDFGRDAASGGNPTMAGWETVSGSSGWHPGPDSASFPPYTVTVSAKDPTGQFSGLELRCDKDTSLANSGDFTWADIYRDTMFTYYTMTIKIEGLEADHTYEKLYLLSVGGGAGAGRQNQTWLQLGTTTTPTPIIHTLGGTPIANNDPGSIIEMSDVTTTALGELAIGFTTASGSAVSSWTNGFILVDYAKPVAEPAGLGLIGMALVSLRRRRS